jgi:hypothetical protein
MPEQNFLEEAKRIGELVTEKDRIYGNALKKGEQFLRLYFPDGIPVESYTDAQAMLRIHEKFNRIATSQGRFDELAENPWQDVIGYALLMVCLQKEEPLKANISLDSEGLKLATSSEQELYEITYWNHRQELSRRVIRIERAWYGIKEPWYPTPRLLLDVWDFSKGDKRTLDPERIPSMRLLPSNLTVDGIMEICSMPVTHQSDEQDRGQDRGKNA